MPGLEIFALAALAAIGAYWFDGLRAREAAVTAARSACHSEGLVLLDWTVAKVAQKLERNESGQIQLRRAYRFEYTSTGNNRLAGSVVLMGREAVLINLAQ